MDIRLEALRGRGIRFVVFWFIVILTVMLDQATKAAAVEVLENGPQVLIEGVINLVHVENTGAAFSIGEGAGAFFIVMALGFLVGSVYFVATTPELPWALVVSVGLVAGGGLGNMLDRIMNGSVTDFLSTAFMNFPVFNVADICVTVGIVVTVVGYWIWESKLEHDDAGQPSALNNDGSQNA